MLSNFDSSNNSLIILKKSLQQTTIKLEKAIDLIEKSNNQPLSNLVRLEKTLARNSDLLLSYLQDSNQIQNIITNNDQFTTIDDRLPSQELQVNQIDSVSNKQKNNNSSPSKQKSQPKVNLIILSVLIISLCFNVYAFLNDRQLVSAINNNFNQEITITPNIDEQKNRPTELIDNDRDSIKPVENNQENNNTQLNNSPLNEDNTKFSDDNKMDLPQLDITTTVPIIEEPKPIPLPNNAKENQTKKSSLLIAIEKQINEISDRYQPDLISKIIPNYTNNSLIIYVNDDWQNLSEKEKDKLSNELYQQAKILDFYRFQLKTIDGNLLARNAVIKDQLIINF